MPDRIPRKFTCILKSGICCSALGILTAAVLYYEYNILLGNSGMKTISIIFGCVFLTFSVFCLCYVVKEFCYYHRISGRVKFLPRRRMAGSHIASQVNILDFVEENSCLTPTSHEITFPFAETCSYQKVRSRNALPAYHDRTSISEYIAESDERIDNASIHTFIEKESVSDAVIRPRSQEKNDTDFSQRDEQSNNDYFGKNPNDLSVSSVLHHVRDKEFQSTYLGWATSNHPNHADLSSIKDNTLPFPTAVYTSKANKDDSILHAVRQDRNTLSLRLNYLKCMDSSPKRAYLTRTYQKAPYQMIAFSVQHDSIGKRQDAPRLLPPLKPHHISDEDTTCNDIEHPIYPFSDYMEASDGIPEIFNDLSGTERDTLRKCSPMSERHNSFGAHSSMLVKTIDSLLIVQKKVELEYLKRDTMGKPYKCSGKDSSALIAGPSETVANLCRKGSPGTFSYYPEWYQSSGSCSSSVISIDKSTNLDYGTFRNVINLKEEPSAVIPLQLLDDHQFSENLHEKSSLNFEHDKPPDSKLLGERQLPETGLGLLEKYNSPRSSLTRHKSGQLSLRGSYIFNSFQWSELGSQISESHQCFESNPDILGQRHLSGNEISIPENQEVCGRPSSSMLVNTINLYLDQESNSSADDEKGS